MILLYQFSLPHLYIALYKVGRMYFWNLGVKGFIDCRRGTVLYLTHFNTSMLSNSWTDVLHSTPLSYLRSTKKHWVVSFLNANTWFVRSVHCLPANTLYRLLVKFLLPLVTSQPFQARLKYACSFNILTKANYARTWLLGNWIVQQTITYYHTIVQLWRSQTPCSCAYTLAVVAVVFRKTMYLNNSQAASQEPFVVGDESPTVRRSLYERGVVFAPNLSSLETKDNVKERKCVSCSRREKLLVLAVVLLLVLALVFIILYAREMAESEEPEERGPCMGPKCIDIASGEWYLAVSRMILLMVSPRTTLSYPHQVSLQRDTACKFGLVTSTNQWTPITSFVESQCLTEEL